MTKFEAAESRNRNPSFDIAAGVHPPLCSSEQQSRECSSSPNARVVNQTMLYVKTMVSLMTV